MKKKIHKVQSKAQSKIDCGFFGIAIMYLYVLDKTGREKLWWIKYIYL